MWEASIHLIEKIPAWYWMIMLPVAALYVVPRIKRNKQGKLYFYSNIVELQKQSARQTKYLEMLTGLQQTLNKLDARIVELEHQSKCSVMENLKQTVHIDSPSMPISERIYAGLRYVIEYHGNSETKKVLLELVKNNSDAYKAICVLKPELSLPSFTSL